MAKAVITTGMRKMLLTIITEIVYLIGSITMSAPIDGMILVYILGLGVGGNVAEHFAEKGAQLRMGPRD